MCVCVCVSVSNIPSARCDVAPVVFKSSTIVAPFAHTTDHVRKYATEEAFRNENCSDSSESEMSDLSEDECQDMEL